RFSSLQLQDRTSNGGAILTVTGRCGRSKDQGHGDCGSDRGGGSSGKPAVRVPQPRPPVAPPLEHYLERSRVWHCLLHPYGHGQYGKPRKEEGEVHCAPP